MKWPGETPARWTKPSMGISGVAPATLMNPESKAWFTPIWGKSWPELCVQKRTVGSVKRGLKRALLYWDLRHSCLSDYPLLSVQPLFSLPNHPSTHHPSAHQCLNIHPRIHYPFISLPPYFLLFSNIPGTLGIRNTKRAGMLFLPPWNSVCLSVTCLTAVTKSLARTPDRRKGLFLAYNSRGHSPLW